MSVNHLLRWWRRWALVDILTLGFGTALVVGYVHYQRRSWSDSTITDETWRSDSPLKHVENELDRYVSSVDSAHTPLCQAIASAKNQVESDPNLAGICDSAKAWLEAVGRYALAREECERLIADIRKRVAEFRAIAWSED
jgi:hypothetical protein